MASNQEKRDKINGTINKIFNSEIFIIIIAIILLLKTIYFYNSTIAHDDNLQMQTIIGTIMFVMSLACFFTILPNRGRIITILVVDLLISLLLWADNVYYIYSSNLLSVSQITNLQYTEEITTTIPSLIRISQIVYIIDLIIIAILLISKVIKIEKKKRTIKSKILDLVVATIGVIIFCMFGYYYIEKGVEKNYNKDLQISEATIYGYHIADIIKSINYKNEAVYKNYDTMIENYNQLKKEYNEQYGQIQYDFKGILENKNIIVLQLESVQEFVVNKTINGREITPNLNKFLKENIEFKNMHMQSYSSTADSEYTFITSTYPMENGMSYSKYFLNTYDDVFKIFKANGYYTSYMHGNVGTFWNRENVYSRIDIDKISFIDDFEDQSELISEYLSDELLYKQGVQKLKEQQEPFITFMVSASSHTAFDLPGIQNKEQKVTIDVGKYKDTYFGNYLEAVNYADYAFGILIDELKKNNLYDDTAILIFGDHNGPGMYDEDLIKFLEEYDSNLTDVDKKLNYTRVLAGLKLPGKNKHIVIDKIINKLDIKPTLTYMCNIKDGFSLGTNVFASKDFVCLNNGRIITPEYYYDENWYSVNSGEEVNIETLSEEEKSKLEKYYNYMQRELDISFSVNINNLLKGREYE